jgi:peptidoglycan hydrolase-like protein with peptidoglycan-binding domain
MAMRASILVLLILGIAASAPRAEAGLSTTPRQTPASVETTTLVDEANRQSEDQIGLTRAKRRDVQRRLTRLGFDTRPSGKFDAPTRDAIARWQEQHGYPRTGFLNAAQHETLLTESAAATEMDKPERHHGGRARRSRGIGGPIGVIGHMVGGIFGR